MKIIFIVDSILVFLCLSSILLFFGNITGGVIFPMHSLDSFSSEVLFEIGDVDFFILDKNEDFSSPEKIYLKEDLEFNLEEGIYYMKIVYEEFEEIFKLTILFPLNLSVTNSDEGFKIVNLGKTSLDVSLYENDSFLESFSVSSSKNFQGGVK